MNDASRLTNIIINELRHNENLFKLIKYDTNDCLDKPNVTEDEKDELVKGGKDILTKRIHKTSCNINLINDVRSELRIYKQFVPINRVRAKVTFYFEIMVNSALWELKNGEERPDKIVFELLKSLQNKDIKSIGYLNFSHPVNHMFFGKDYFGYMLIADTSIEWEQ